MKLVVLRLIGLSLLVKSESWEDWNRHMVSMMDKHAVLKHLCNERACSKCIDVFETEYVQSSRVYTLCFRILAKDSCQGSKSLIRIVSIDQSQKYEYHITHCYTVIGQFKYYEPTILNLTYAAPTYTMTPATTRDCIRLNSARLIAFYVKAIHFSPFQSL